MFDLMWCIKHPFVVIQFLPRGLFASTEQLAAVAIPKSLRSVARRLCLNAVCLFLVGMSSQNVMPKCHCKMSSENVISNCHPKMSSQCHPKMSSQNVIAECYSKISSQNAMPNDIPVHDTPVDMSSSCHHS